MKSKSQEECKKPALPCLTQEFTLLGQKPNYAGPTVKQKIVHSLSAGVDDGTVEGVAVKDIAGKRLENYKDKECVMTGKRQRRLSHALRPMHTSQNRTRKKKHFNVPPFWRTTHLHKKEPQVSVLNSSASRTTNRTARLRPLQQGIFITLLSIIERLLAQRAELLI